MATQTEFTLSDANIGEHINDCLDNFRFKRVANLMQMMCWHWRDEDSAPSVDELRHEAKRLLYQVWGAFKKHQERCSTATGGFQVSCNGYQMELVFAFEQWDTNHLIPEEEEEEFAGENANSQATH